MTIGRSQCPSCKHLNRGTKTCDAFPNGIPQEIMRGFFDHRKKHPEDNGIQYEPVDDAKVIKVTK